MISDDARALLAASDVIDLHVDGYIWRRVFGYDLRKRHGLGLLGGRFYGHLDLPRAQAGGLTGAMWSITTNPLRSAAGRWRAFQRNLDGLEALCRSDPAQVRIARSLSEYRAARAAGVHACLPAIQGGNAIDGAPLGAASIRDGLITCMTLVHLSNSQLGATSSPAALGRRHEGLTPAGKALVEELDRQRIFVDLAHINRAGFWDAVACHDAALPLLATHTGVSGVLEHWRNLDDRQLVAIADTGGVIGILFHPPFLRPKGAANDCELVLDHMAHVVKVAGEQSVAIGSDFDGAITPSPDLRQGATAYGRLVQAMLKRGWASERIQAILGGNFLRAFGELRP